MQIDGQHYPVTVQPAKPGMNQPSVDDVAKALAAAPKVARQDFKGITIQGDNTGVFGTTGSLGQMTVPAKAAPGTYSQGWLDSAVLHESGHALSGTKFGDNTAGAGWNDWKSAMNKDGIIPSQYAKTGGPFADDFSETLLLYEHVKGKPEEAELRELMPNRFKIIDDLEAGRR